MDWLDAALTQLIDEWHDIEGAAMQAGQVAQCHQAAHDEMHDRIRNIFDSHRAKGE